MTKAGQIRAGNCWHAPGGHKGGKGPETVILERFRGLDWRMVLTPGGESARCSRMTGFNPLGQGWLVLRSP